MSKTRIKIPKKIEDEVMTKSEGKCFCGKKGDNIHHLDENPANNDFDNLILLCYDHHHDTSVKNGLKKKFSIKQLKRLRNKLYRHNEQKRDIELKHYGSTLKKITDENLFRAALDANIVLEIIKISSEYNQERDWEKRSDIMWKLNKFSEYSNFRISHHVIKSLMRMSDYARSGMPYNLSETISGIILEFFPYPENNQERKVTIEIAEKCCYIAHAIAYDAFIYLGNLAVASSGLEILKYLYGRGKEWKIPEISEIVIKKYSELEENLHRPERNDLENAKRFLKIYKEDLDRFGLHLPDNIPTDLFHLFQKHMEEARQRKIKI